MVTFLLSNGNYVFAFEDLGPSGDRDYNDLVVELKLNTTGPGPLPTIPEPAAVGLFGFGTVFLWLRSGAFGPKVRWFA
jgi:hypothetical protein